MALQSITALSKIILQEASSTVTFSGIPDTYRDLTLVISGQTAASGRPVIRLNGDTGSNYSSVMAADGPYGTTTSGTYLDPIPGFSVTGNFSSTWELIDSGASDKHTTVLVRLNQHAGAHLHMTAGRWANTNAVSSITVLSNTGINYSAGTVFALFGRIA
jgi:hypothetical protein